ncbi:MAG: U32 family peptidase [Candidatus Omnitrophica bacterium]|nr:U32 family peptidase [Candidatus Omnitrophota bacterium]
MADGIKFSVGYQLIEEGKTFLEIAKKFREKIDEVYFSWLNLPSGRGPIANKKGYINWEAQQQMEYELKGIKKSGIKLNLLLNASCWGGISLSKSLANTVLSIIDHLEQKIGIDSITVFSPAIAHTIKKNFHEMEIRASVNMKIGTKTAMEQLSELFDGFVMQREYNRDFEKIKELKAWCEKNGKKLSMLANSGCINHCAVQIFHDNVIAHETEVFTKNNISDDIPGNCWSYYRNKENWKNLLFNHSWVRPEDIHFYKGYFTNIKLATRISPFFEKIIEAYCKEKFDGNLLDIFEPSHSGLIFPHIIDNSKFPEQWFQTLSRCNKDCTECSFCKETYLMVVRKQGA